jgi:hypothetical protein
VEALFKAMASDFLLREQLVTDPARILAEYVQGERLEPQRADDTYRLVYREFLASLEGRDKSARGLCAHVPEVSASDTSCSARSP